MKLPAGARIGGCSILETIGEGGMGVVYRAREEKTGREVALKTIAPGALTAPGMLDRFEREARALARVLHPNVARLFASGEERGVAYLVFELVRGTSLEERVRKAGALPWREATSLAIQIAHALAAVHGNGLVHRDVKPSNVLVMEDGTAKLTDFGLVRAVARDDSLAGSLTQAGSLLGTVGFMAPEQVEGTPAGPAADLYALGATFFLLLTGAPPFSGTALDVMRLTVKAPAPSARSRVKGLPRELDAVIARLLSKDPRARGESAETLAVELETIARAHSPMSRRAPVFVVLALALVLLLVLLLALVLATGLTTEVAPRARAPAPPPAQPRKPAPLDEESELPAPLRSFQRTKRSRLTGFAGSYAWRHAQPVEAVSLAPRAQLVLSAAGWTEKTLRAWTVDRGDERWTAVLPSGARALAVSADERLAVAGCEDGSVAVLDVASGKRLRALAPHAQAVTGAAFLPGSTRVVVASRDGVIGCVDADSGAPVWEVNAGAPVRGLAARPASPSVVATALETGELVARSASTGAVLASAPEKDPGPLACVAYSPDGSRLATGSESGTFAVRDAVSLARIDKVPPVGFAIHAVAFDRDADHAVTAIERGVTLFWDLDPLRAMVGKTHDDQTALVVSPDGLVVTGGKDRRVHLWNRDATLRPALEDPLDLDTFPDAVVALPGGRVVTGGASGVLHVLELSRSGGREVGKIDLAHGALEGLAATREGEKVYCGMGDGAVLEVHLVTSEVRVLDHRQHDVRAIAVSPDGRSLAYGTDAGVVWSYDLVEGRLSDKPVSLHGPKAVVDSVSWSSDGQDVLSVSRYGTVALTGEPTRLFRPNGSYLTCAACSPDRPLALLSAHEEYFLLWDMEKDVLVDSLPCGVELTRCVWLGPRHAAIAAFDGTIQIVDVDARELVDRIDLSGSQDFATALAADGKDLIAVTSRGVVLRFAIDLPEK